MTKAHGVMKIEDIIHTQPFRLLVLFDTGHERIAQIIAQVLGQTHSLREAIPCGDERGREDETVLAIDNCHITRLDDLKRLSRIIITTHCIDDSVDRRDEDLTAQCDYEYLYQKDHDVRRDLARFLAFVLGQWKPHEDLRRKSRTFMLCTTFPDIRAALPNLDILSVGADAVELRVDLLQDEHYDGTPGQVPNIKYVGEQVMLLRQRTELPIVYCTRCTNENGRFPMDDPALFYKYLYKAKQWGCEYIDVEMWLPEEIRRNLNAEKGASRVISAWHDFSGQFSWRDPRAYEIFNTGMEHSDIVKMIALVDKVEHNYDLETLRTHIHALHPQVPFSSLCMSGAGQLSRLLNKVFTPGTHPLLPLIAAPGQLSAAEINARLHSMGQTPALDLFAIGNVRGNGQAMFFEKCLNELSLPHRLLTVERTGQGSIESFVRQRTFGGAFMSPPLPANVAYLPRITEAANSIGSVDTVVVTGPDSLLGDNVTWKGIRQTLTTDFVPSAYAGQAALVLSSSEAQAAAAIFALQSLDVSAILTIGFKATGALADHVIQLKEVEDLQHQPAPFAVVSALAAEKSFTVLPLLKHYGSKMAVAGRHTKVFVDLANGVRGNGDSVATARSLGYQAYSIADVNAWTMVSTLRLLVGQNVPFDFVRLAAGRSLYA